jgi:NADH dehydrogenase [ubiquinone] 1 alpha subcomplex assembly factor 1
MKIPNVKTLMLSLLLMGSASAWSDTRYALRIADTENMSQLGWRVINDTVMGGRSTSQVKIEDGALSFSGYLNTDGGGFASVRSSRQRWAIEGRTLIRVRVRGDGRQYELRLHVGSSDVAYKAPFTTTANTWQVFEADIADFIPTRRGRVLTLPAPRARDVTGIGFLLADRTDGLFRLDVAWIDFASAANNQRDNAKPSP